MENSSQLQATKYAFELQNIHLTYSVQKYPSEVQSTTFVKPMQQPLLLSVTET